jgi:hypothetical protein
MSRGEYRVAQVCVNGHAVNAYADTNPQHNQQFCQQCGAPTITACQQCNTPIRGKYITPGVIVATPYTPPRFCPNCGQAYPWTEAKIRAAEELSNLIETLTEAERAELKESIRNIVRDTPQTLIAAVKFRGLMAKAGPVMKAALWETIADVADSKAKQLINS